MQQGLHVHGLFRVIYHLQERWPWNSTLLSCTRLSPSFTRLISCTIDEQLLSYQDPWARDPGGRTGAIKAKKIDPKQIPRIQSKLDAIMRPIAQQIITDINEGKCIKEVGLRGVVESRVATAGMLMHKNPLGRDNRARERGPHRSQEQVEILKELATLIAARTTRGRPGRASVAVQQCMTQFGLYSDFKMTPQEVKRVANLPEWTTVLEVMIKSRREDLAFRTTKQERWNQRAQDRQAHQDFLEEHRGTGKFSGKYAPQPQQTELIWTMPWGCWVELDDKDVHCKEWKCIIENFAEEEADTTVHQIMVSVQHSALITSREIGIVYKLGY